MIELITRYLEPHRVYHRLNHIVQMFEFAKTHGVTLSPEQMYAVLFHDAVYVPGAKDNEEKSAEVFLDWETSQHKFLFKTDLIKQIILDTKEEVPTIEESELVIDLDLHQLAYTPEFQNNALLIREEFLPFVGEEGYNRGRAAWLKGMLARQTIFVSNHPAFRSIECAARWNLQNELRRLGQE